MIVSSRPLLFFAFALLFGIGLLDNMRGPLLPEITEQFLLPHAQSAAIFSASAWASIVGCLLAGRWLRGRTPVQVTRIGMVTLLGGVLLVAWSGWWPAVIIGSAVYGIGSASCQVAMNVLLAVCTTTANRVRVMNWFHVMYGVSSFLAPIVVAGLRRSLDWSATLTVATSVVLGVLGWSAALRAPPCEDAAVPLQAVTAWRNPTCYVHGALLGLYVTAELAVSNWLVLYLDQSRHLPINQARGYLAGFFMCMAVVRLLGGPIVQRLPLRRVMTGAATAAVLMLGAGLLGHPVWLSLSALGFGVLFPTGVAALSHELPRTQRESGLSAVFTLMFAAVGVGQLMMGRLADQYSLQHAMWIPIGLMIAVALGWALRKTPPPQDVAS